MTGAIYGLYSSAEPLQIRYVGRTVNSLDTRLGDHLSKSRRPTNRFPVCDWIRLEYAKGNRVRIRELGRYNVGFDLSRAEKAWIRFWSAFCDSVNHSMRPTSPV